LCFRRHLRHRLSRHRTTPEQGTIEAISFVEIRRAAIRLHPRTRVSDGATLYARKAQPETGATSRCSHQLWFLLRQAIRLLFHTRRLGVGRTTPPDLDQLDHRIPAEIFHSSWHSRGNGFLDMSAFKIGQFPDDFPLPLVELEILIRILLRPFAMSGGLRNQKWLHFLVDFPLLSVKFFDPLEPLHHKYPTSRHGTGEGGRSKDYVEIRGI
jgi:hypothetical protein